MKQRFLKPDEVKTYKIICDTYHPDGQIVIDFARSNFAVIAGPTGAGKDTLRNALLQKPNYTKILSTSSRPMRDGEKDGVEYHFRDLKFFDQGIQEKRFLQVALVHNQQLASLDFADIKQLKPEHIALAILVVQTEIDLRKLNPNMKTVFVVPPSIEILKQRIQKERIMNPDELMRRMQAAKNELQIALNQQSYFCIINDDITRATDLVAKYFEDSQKNIDEDSSARAIIKQILSSLGDMNE